MVPSNSRSYCHKPVLTLSRESTSSSRWLTYRYLCRGIRERRTKKFQIKRCFVVLYVASVLLCRVYRVIQYWLLLRQRAASGSYQFLFTTSESPDHFRPKQPPTPCRIIMNTASLNVSHHKTWPDFLDFPSYNVIYAQQRSVREDATGI